MDVIYSTSNLYVQCTSISVYSLLFNNTDEKITLHILCFSVEDNYKKMLSDIAEKFNTEIVFYDVSRELTSVAESFCLQQCRGGYSTYARMFLNVWFKKLKRVVVIDSDTIVVGSISDFYNINMENALVAAVPEAPVYAKGQHIEDYDLISSCKHYYCNMGVALINLELWREENIDQYLQDKILSFKGEFRVFDQSIINRFLTEYVIPVPLKYNFYSPAHHTKYSTFSKVFNAERIFSKQEYEDAQTNPVVIHFYGHPYERPWFKHNASPYNELYDSYRKQTPWTSLPKQKWGKSKNLTFAIYDRICFLLLKLKLFDFTLKFRYLVGQKIKSILKSNR